MRTRPLTRNKSLLSSIASRLKSSWKSRKKTAIALRGRLESERTKNDNGTLKIQPGGVNSHALLSEVR